MSDQAEEADAPPISQRRLRVLEPERPRIRRPVARGDCLDGPRPCPWLSCRHHLYLEVAGDGFLRPNFPEIEPSEMQESCSLDVADRGGAKLADVGALLNITRERARQIEAELVARPIVQAALRVFVEDEIRMKRRAYAEFEPPTPDPEDDEDAA